MFITIDLVKAIACLLIVNFHCSYVYPESLAVLSFGGDLGNNIFFMISGFSLFPSIERSSFNEIGSWVKKRYLRILPLSMMFNMLSYLFMPNREFVGSIFHCFIFPMVYWFIGALFLFYPLIFLVQKIKNEKMEATIIVLLLVLHVIFDSVQAERYFIGFIAMIVGCWLRKNAEKLEKRRHCLIVSTVSFFIYAFLKIIYAKEIGQPQMIHLLIGIVILLTSIFLILGLFRREKELKIMVEKNVWLNKIIHFVSNLTLSVYLCQQLINFTIVDLFLKLKFPFSVAAYLIATFAAAYLAYWVDIWLRKVLLKNKL